MKKAIIVLAVLFSVISVSAQKESFISFTSYRYNISPDNLTLSESVLCDVLITFKDNRTIKVYSNVPQNYHVTSQGKTDISERGNKKYRYSLVDLENGEELEVFIEMLPEGKASLLFIFKTWSILYSADVNE